MKKIFLILAAAAMTLPCGAWGRRNHAAIAYIAEQHLTPKAYATVKEILHGESLTYYASWVDDFRGVELLTANINGKDTLLAKPHCFAVDKKLKPTVTPYKDAIWVIEDSMEKLGNYKDLDDSIRLDCMKNLIHLVGDIHCPAHITYKDKRDHKHGKFVAYTAKGAKIPKAHTFIDGDLLGAKFPGGMTDMAYYADPLLRPYPTEADLKYMKEVQKGSVRDWGKDIATRSGVVFQIMPPEHRLTPAEQQQITDICKDQVLRAGYRLAAVLNQLFD